MAFSLRLIFAMESALEITDAADMGVAGDDDAATVDADPAGLG